jgi:hypothetical protein
MIAVWIGGRGMRSNPKESLCRLGTADLDLLQRQPLELLLFRDRHLNFTFVPDDERGAFTLCARFQPAAFNECIIPGVVEKSQLLDTQCLCKKRERLLADPASSPFNIADLVL